MYKPIRVNKGGHLSKQYDLAHDLCLVLHDFMLNIVKTDGIHEVFYPEVFINSEEEFESLKTSDNVLDWLENTKTLEERAIANRTLIFPYLLSDLLMCVFECLETSRKGKLTPSYMLVRKPLQENLFLLELIFLDEVNFLNQHSKTPLQLRPKTAGGIQGHVKRIKKVIEEMGEDDRFDAEFIANLRYSKEWGFDGICNKAMHLFTEHKSIQTKPYNINFIYFDKELLNFYWGYLYSFLPYLLLYVHMLVESIMSRIAPTSTEYLHVCFRRLAALTLCWADQMESEDFFLNDEHIKLFSGTQNLLNLHCINHGYRKPWKKDLKKLRSAALFQVNRKVR